MLWGELPEGSTWFTLSMVYLLVSILVLDAAPKWVLVVTWVAVPALAIVANVVIMAASVLGYWFPVSVAANGLWPIAIGIIMLLLARGAVFAETKSA